MKGGTTLSANIAEVLKGPSLKILERHKRFYRNDVEVGISVSLVAR